MRTGSDRSQLVAAGGARKFLAESIAGELCETASGMPWVDEWDYLTHGVWTQDQASGRIRRFPDWDYLREIVIERGKHKLFAIVKSRRMLISWLMCALYLYETIAARNQSSYICARKFESSCELVGRCAFIYSRLEWPKKPQVLTYSGQSSRGFARLMFPTLGSEIVAVAKGADQLRQYGASRVLCDEAAFWTKWPETWSALRPTIQGGGRIDIVTTPEATSPIRELLYGGVCLS